MSTDSPRIYQSEKDLSKAQYKINSDPRYWTWFEQWWAQDFSWEGLAKRKIEGWDDGRTLQDYWREEEDRLIEFAGRWWTRFHLPPHDRSGEEKSEKEGWHIVEKEKWQKDILEKIRSAPSPETFLPDTRAQLSGICCFSPIELSHDASKGETVEQQEERKLRLLANWVHFTNSQKFNWAYFDFKTDFSHTYFGESVEFSNASFGDHLNFSDAIFEINAFFEYTRFGKCSQFTRTNFGDHAIFRYAYFLHEAWFEDARFGDYTTFESACFTNSVSFYKSIFTGFTDFTTKRASPIERGAQCKHDFTLAEFQNDIDFSDREFGAKTTFESARFSSATLFYNCKFHPSISFADAEFKFDNHDAGINFVEYQNAFQTLRLHMEKIRNHEQELKFSRLEMRARERRVGSKDVPWWVRWLSRGYGLFTDYAQSAWRPLLWLIGSFFLAAALYASIAGNWPIPSDAFSVAFQYSLPPVSTFAAQFFAGEVDQSFINALLDHPFLTRLVMVTHGVASLALVFFLLLALKRRFQIR